ncbi:MAG: hypothetical protein A2474_04755 [Elusimicrobia bacterium RIFOXYC2_FULL_34_12]|nr:MAG: hypothetical protein A2474_04755 [Elusimicrobia bacterium RIFOXYC2_FULL_34_12]OGS39171.1 MAG: hypothetical protein A2551_05460 [Elusimicrobia bacterium RIFOXYD2_FULL_34_30]HAM38038.1 hypothetical protein [Elusimicrobiota bacterium]
MKIGFIGIEIPEGKIKYKDEKFVALENKCEPKKITPYFVEFIINEFVQVNAIVISKDKILDLLIPDIEKLEARVQNTNDNFEKELIKKCISCLENEMPLCDIVFNEQEQKLLQMLSPNSMKPIVIIDDKVETNEIIEKVLKKSQTIFFYTAGKDEVHAWPVKAGSDIVTCAGRIHSDLARGFIKADIVSFDNFMKCHNFNDAKTKGLVKLVDREYIIQESDIIEIRFNV